MLSPDAPEFLEQLDANFGERVRSPLGQIALLLPAWQPPPGFPAMVEELGRCGFGAIVVVDDGSTEVYRPVFAQIAALPRVEVLHHGANLGKGRALKTGFNYLLTAHRDLSGVVTADADGQHTPEDIERVGRVLAGSEARPVFGVRGFDSDVPWRSRIGNAFTRKVFALITGVSLRDTQTGLRGLPLALLPELLSLEGERYEYEMNMLAHLCREGRVPVEVPIATVYLENNRGSHFNPVWDSMRIFIVLARFLASGRRATSVLKR